jgi:hypothetical protein
MGGPGPIPGSVIREWAAREWPGRERWAAGVVRLLDRIWFEEEEFRRKLTEGRKSVEAATEGVKGFG